MNLTRHPTWNLLAGRSLADTAPATLIASYLRRTGWHGDVDTGWTKTTEHGRTTLQSLPLPDYATARGLPQGPVNGLVQRQLATDHRDHITAVITVLLSLEALEDRSATVIWAEIANDVALHPQPTLREQAASIADELADLGAYTMLRDIAVGWQWPMVAVDLDDFEALIAIPTPPAEVPPGFTPAACWHVDLEDAPTVAAQVGQSRFAYAPPAFIAPVLRRLADAACARATT
ncbi:hypothetical protein ACIGO9_30335 [Nocardia asteroides]|uniref:hypothetical protein n=1 Tax=Nocardia asteroides TaxID=1824 RepID=UPI0037C50E70